MNNYTAGDILRFKGERPDEKGCGLLLLHGLNYTTQSKPLEVLRFTIFADCPVFDVRWIDETDIIDVIGHINLRDFLEASGYYNTMINLFTKYRNDYEKEMDRLDQSIDLLLKEKGSSEQ